MSAPGELPHTQGMGTAVSIPLLVALLSAAAALAGLLYPAIVHPNTELSQSFVTNDAVNLFLGVPAVTGDAVPGTARRFAGVCSFGPVRCSLSLTTASPMSSPCRCPGYRRSICS
ncbi:MAG: hypothetical protein IPM39_25795 [Chloroflexi bacterium]|nr:hypothetical protein [Chloroflexota bacterium]